MPSKHVEDGVRRLADGDRTINEIAAELGVGRTTVKRVLTAHPEIPRRSTGMPEGKRAPSYKCGRSVTTDGYVLVSAPAGHPHARYNPGRKIGRILEHRLIMEEKLGRYLHPGEVVDHIDGLTLHNHPDNLHLYYSNESHLVETTGGKKKAFSSSGRNNIGARTDLGREIVPRSTYRLRKERGDVRLRQILLAWFRLDKDSPYLLGTHHHLEKAGIDPYSRSSLERGLADLSARWESDLLP